MNESDYNDLIEKSWRRKLMDAEAADLRAWLAGHPESAEDWQIESRLSRVLDRLPDAPVPSNFTARVLQAVEREGNAASRPRGGKWYWFLRSLLPRAAVAAMILGVGLFTYHEHMAARQAQMVQDVKVVTSVRSLPSPEILQDFDTIQKMGSTPGPDPELIALMK
jgi:anti-sigma factor RsiW